MRWLLVAVQVGACAVVILLGVSLISTFFLDCAQIPAIAQSTTFCFAAIATALGMYGVSLSYLLPRFFERGVTLGS